MVKITRSISLIIPAYNEEERILFTLRKVSQYLRNNFFEYEIIVVDDGSRDKTFDLVRQFAGKTGNSRIVPFRIERNKGKGGAIRMGVRQAKKDLVAFVDADLAYDLEGLSVMAGIIEEKGMDMVIGGRDLPGSHLDSSYSITRKFMGKTYSLLIRLFLFPGIPDTQCGFKCFKRKSAQRLFEKVTIDRFGFDVEALYIAEKWNLKIERIPVKLTCSGDSRVNLLFDSLNMFFDLFRIRRNERKGLYKDEGGG